MKRHILRAISLLALVFSLALASPAQSERPAPQSSPKANSIFFVPGPQGDRVFALENIIGDFGEHEVITNAPFSAQVVRETVQTLADGNRIDRKQTGMIARDSSGRTRREISLGNIGFLQGAQNLAIITIQDPVTGETYFLNEEKKTAVNISRRHGRNRERIPRETRREDASAQTESLGPKTIAGISVQGTRYTRTIPAGKIGNEKPIVITEEKWVSPDLHITVSMMRSDPRFGTSSYQLTDISRAAPSSSLFTVPSDYRILRGKTTVRHRQRHSNSQF